MKVSAMIAMVLSASVTATTREMPVPNTGAQAPTPTIDVVTVPLPVDNGGVCMMRSLEVTFEGITAECEAMADDMGKKAVAFAFDNLGFGDLDASDVEETSNRFLSDEDLEDPGGRHLGSFSLGDSNCLPVCMQSLSKRYCCYFCRCSKRRQLLRTNDNALTHSKKVCGMVTKFIGQNARGKEQECFQGVVVDCTVDGI